MTDVLLTLEQVQTYLPHDPDNRDLLAAAIDLHLAAGQIAAVREFAETALAHYPDDPFFRHRLGNVLIAQGELVQAEALFAALASEFADPGIAYNLAYTYFLQGRYQDAKNCLLPYIGCGEALKDHDMSNGVTLFLRTLHHLGETKQALTVAQRYLEKQVNDAAFLAAASLLYLDDGQIELAKKLARAVQSQGEFPPEALAVEATVALSQGDATAAQAQFSKLLERHPADGRAWASLGVASLLMQDIPGAEKQLEQAVTYLPTHLGALHALAWCKILRHDFSAAEAIFHQALLLNRSFSETHGGLAVVAACNGQSEMARAHLARALRLDPHSLAAGFARMVLSDTVKDPSQFREQAFKVLSMRQGPGGNTLAQMLVTWLGKTVHA